MAAVFVAVACTSNPNAILTGPIDPSKPIPPAPSTAMIAGRIIVSGEDADRVVDLRDDHGDVFRLLGSVGALTSVDGGDVIAHGTWDANPGFVVLEFQVVGMYGRPALDGVLEVSEEGFALRLTDGSMRLLPELTDCADYVGARLWVVGWDEAADVAFGLIAELQTDGGFRAMSRKT